MPKNRALARHGNGRALPYLGRDAVKFSRPHTPVSLGRGGDNRATRARETKQGNRLMNVIRQVDAEEAEMEGGAASEVEAGIRDFVRNDVAYLRRPMANENGLDANAEATVNNVNSLIQRVAGTSLAEIEHLITELEGLRDL